MLGDKFTTRALLDLGASVNLLPYSLYLELGLQNMKPTRVTLQLADRSVKVPKGIVEDVMVKVSDFYYPVDFIILDTPAPDPTNIPIILGRPFLATANAIINCRDGSMNLSFGNMTVEVNIFHLMQQQADVDSIDEVCMIDFLVQEMLDTTYPEDPIHQCLAHFGSDFDIDSSISEVNALLDSTPLLDTSTWAPPFEPLLVDTLLSVDDPVIPVPIFSRTLFLRLSPRHLLSHHLVWS